jgi:hypothetical protein
MVTNGSATERKDERKDVMRTQRMLVLLVLLSMLFLMGNLPAPYYACEGKQVGDACTYGYGSGCASNRGVCTLSDSFQDDPDTPELNEQLICVTE